MKEVEVKNKEFPIIWLPNSVIYIHELVFPPLQALYDSPNWKPVKCEDNIIYVWNNEAVIIPSDRRWILIWRTRKSSKVLATYVEPIIVGGRLSNMLQPPISVSASTNAVVSAILAFATVDDVMFAEDSAEKLYEIGTEKDGIRTLAGTVSVNAELKSDKLVATFRFNPAFEEITEDRRRLAPEDLVKEFEKFVESWRLGT